MSQFTTLSLLNTKSYTAALTVFPTNCGTFWMGLSQKNVKQAYTWFEQAIDQIDALELTVRSLVMASLQRDLQFSICVSYLAEQEDRVYPPTDAFLRHLISRMLGIAQESYYEFMTINLPLIATEAYSMNKHFHYSPLWRILHSVTGVNSWTLAILKVFVTIFYILLLPRFVLALMKTPESSMAQTASGFFKNPRRQLFQRCTAMPPAEPPVSTTFCAFFNPYLTLIQLKWDLVIAAPLKYS